MKRKTLLTGLFILIVFSILITTSFIVEGPTKLLEGPTPNNCCYPTICTDIELVPKDCRCHNNMYGCVLREEK